MYKFQIGDIAKCVNTCGWGNMEWYNGKPFKIVYNVDLELLNGTYNEDFILISVKDKKIIKPYGIVKFLEKTCK